MDQNPKSPDATLQERQKQSHQQIKVITDIDDCVKSSGGVKFCGIALGGIDKQYDRGQFYPGLLANSFALSHLFDSLSNISSIIIGTFQFAFELSRQHLYNPNNTNTNTDTNNKSSNANNKSKTQSDNVHNSPTLSSNSSSSSSSLSFNSSSQQSIESVAVLTARAREFKLALAIKPTDKLCDGYRRTGLKYGYPSWGIGLNEVFYGSVVEWILQHRKGLRKSTNFNILLENDRRDQSTRTRQQQHQQRSLKYIFIGDTGDRDEDAAERMIQNHGSLVLLAVFLHVVSNDPFGVTTALPEDRVYNSVPIYYFRTYVSAGWKAYQNGYISRSALQCIIDESLQDLEYEHNLSTIPSVSLISCCCSCSCCFHSNSQTNKLRLESRWNDIRSDVHLIEQVCPTNETSLRQTLLSAEHKLSSGTLSHTSEILDVDGSSEGRISVVIDP